MTSEAKSDTTIFCFGFLLFFISFFIITFTSSILPGRALTVTNFLAIGSASCINARLCLEYHRNQTPMRTHTHTHTRKLEIETEPTPTKKANEIYPRLIFYCVRRLMIPWISVRWCTLVRRVSISCVFFRRRRRRDPASQRPPQSNRALYYLKA